MITKRISSSVFFPLIAAFVVLSMFQAAPAHAQNVEVDLSSTSALCGGHACFNVAGIFTTGTQFLGTSGMDNGNNCTPTAPYTNCPDAYSSNQLNLSSATPPTLTPPSLNVPFVFGVVNTVNCGPSTSKTCIENVVNLTSSGVNVTLPVDKQSIYSTLIMLGTAVNGHHAGQVTATYTTGAPDVFPQTFSDWCGYGGNPNESVAVSGIERINSDGTLNGANCDLYGYTYPLDYTRKLQSITLTDEDGSSAMFALAITLKPPTYTIAGGAPTPSSVTAGSDSTATVTVNPQPGYVGTVTLSCSISPTIVTSSAAMAPTCALSPTAVTVTAGEKAPPTSTLKFTSSPESKMSSARRSNLISYALLLQIPGLALLGLGLAPSGSRRKRWLGFWMVGLLLALLLLSPACVSTTHLGNVGTPPGQYTISITGVDANGLSQASNPAGTSNAVIVNVTDK